MICACGNAARYINARGELCCGICPIKESIDSIKLASVPELLRLVRGIIYMRDATASEGIIRTNIDARIQKLREVVGVVP